MINIAIDGCMGSGKSTLAKELAKRLGYKILDTGAIFRTLAYGYLKSDFGRLTDKKAEKFVKNIKVEVVFKDDVQHMLLDGKDVTAHLRTEEISQMASMISAIPKVREVYLVIAKKFAEEYDCVMEGRDIGSRVMPNADVKIFLTADEEVRAKRRFEEIKQKDKKAKFEDVLANLRERDNRDRTRSVDPLMPTEESLIVDNTDMNVEETVEFCLGIISKRIKNCINIAIDGYVCSGKSSIAKALAKKLKFKVLDTGAIYRGLACAFDYLGLDEKKINETYIKKFINQVNVDIEFINGVQHVRVNGIDHTNNLRTERISTLTSKISPYACVRKKVMELQRKFAKKNDLVMEGRDIGSHVLPDADFKFFCVADELVRANRRYEQQKAMGNDVVFENILRELQQRDYADVHRNHGAIKKLPESIVIDTTNQSLEQSVEFCLKEMSKRGFKF